MSGFEELEESLTPLNWHELERTAREADNYGFGEASPHAPDLQWSQSPLLEAVRDATGVLLAPFRAIMRLMPRA